MLSTAGNLLVFLVWVLCWVCYTKFKLVDFILVSLSWWHINGNVIILICIFLLTNTKACKEKQTFPPKGVCKPSSKISFCMGKWESIVLGSCVHLIFWQSFSAAEEAFGLLEWCRVVTSDSIRILKQVTSHRDWRTEKRLHLGMGGETGLTKTAERNVNKRWVFWHQKNQENKTGIVSCKGLRCDAGSGIWV